MAREIKTGGAGIFVGRAAEIEEFEDALGRLQRRGTVSGNLREIYGIPGMGKSELLRQFEQIAIDSGVPHVYLDFTLLETKNIDQDPSLLLEEMVEQLGSKVDARSYQNAREVYLSTSRPENVVVAYEQMDQETRLYRRPEWLEEHRHQTIELIKIFNQLGGNGIPQVLFLDNAQNIEIGTADFIEEWMINPLVQVPGSLVYWTERRPWRWKRPEIRRRLMSSELRRLNHEEVASWAESVWGTVTPAYINQIEKATQGIPGALQSIV